MARRDQRPEVADYFTNLYVSNLPRNLSDEEFKAIFSPFGEIQNCKYSAEKGSGFVKYHNHNQAQAAIDGLHQRKEFDGNCIFVQKHIYANQNQMMTGPTAQNIGEQMKKNYQANIFVKFVPKSVTDVEFKNQMSKAGKVLSFMLRDHMQTNKSTGEKYSNYK